MTVTVTVKNQSLTGTIGGSSKKDDQSLTAAGRGVPRRKQPLADLSPAGKTGVGRKSVPQTHLVGALVVLLPEEWASGGADP